jgi:hypothetical protein
MMRLALLVSVLAVVTGCGAELQPETEAQRYAPAGDTTSCRATRSTTGCGPAIACTGTLAACAARGCWIVQTELYLYADGSWRDPEPEPGTWSFPPGYVASNGAPFDFGCSPTGGQ